MTRRLLALACGCALLVLTRHARAAPPSSDVVAVIVGANLGSASEEPLRYAVSDARRMNELLGELGDVRPGNAVLVTADDPGQVLAALRDAKQRAAALAHRGHRVTFLFYYSGHGDDGALHLAKGVLLLKDLRAAIADVTADLRVSILDACRTGGRAKGISVDAAFELQVEPDAPRGNVELRASAVGEAAQESDELGGAVFTHFVVTGLRGAADANGDGRVSLDELYAYAYDKTLLRTTTATVLQHPAVKLELEGAGEVILTTPGAAHAFLAAPRGSARYLVFARPSGAAMGELGGSGARLALPSGKYVVVRRDDNVTSAAAVDLSAGGAKRLDDADFHPIAREELARRGGDLELLPWRVEARLGGELAPGSGDRLAARAGVALVRSLGGVELGVEAAYVVGPFDADAFPRGSVQSVALDPEVGVRVAAGRLVLVPFVGAELRGSWEHLVRADAARVTAAGLARSEDRSFGSIGPRVGARGAFALGNEWSASLAASFAALLRHEADRDETTPITVHPVLGVTIAVGRAF